MQEMTLNDGTEMNLDSGILDIAADLGFWLEFEEFRCVDPSCYGTVDDDAGNVNGPLHAPLFADDESTRLSID